jgi:hypothetical protein
MWRLCTPWQSGASKPTWACRSSAQYVRSPEAYEDNRLHTPCALRSYRLRSRLMETSRTAANHCTRRNIEGSVAFIEFRGSWHVRMVYPDAIPFYDR